MSEFYQAPEKVYIEGEKMTVYMRDGDAVTSENALILAHSNGYGECAVVFVKTDDGTEYSIALRCLDPGGTGMLKGFTLPVIKNEWTINRWGGDNNE